MKHILVLSLVAIVMSCNQTNFQLEYAQLPDIKKLESLSFSDAQKELIEQTCSVLTQKQIQPGITRRFEVRDSKCDGSSETKEVDVKVVFSGQHHFYEAANGFPFYQEEGPKAGVLKDLCLNRSGKQLVQMSSHGASVRYLFEMSKDCKQGHACYDISSIVQDYRSKKVELSRKERIDLIIKGSQKGEVSSRELVFRCKDQKSLKRVKATLL